MNITELLSYLGLSSYYRRFIPNFTGITKPVYCLTENVNLKVYICRNTDFWLNPLILDTDDSNTSTGSVSSKVHDNKESVTCYGSRMLAKCERNLLCHKKGSNLFLWCTF